MIKEILENALYHLRFECKNLNDDIEREKATINHSQEMIDKKILRLTTILDEVDAIRAAAKSLGITLEIREAP